MASASSAAAASAPSSAVAAATPRKAAVAARNPLHRRWTYWELRNAWKKGGAKQDWDELPISLFDFDTVEDFWIAYRRCPSIVEVFDDGRNGVANEVERKEPNGTVIRTTAKGYMLFRQGLRPETSFEVGGERVNRNGYRTEVSCSPSDFQNFQDAWETCVLAVIGESVDPAEFINGVYLTDKGSSGGSGGKRSTALRLEVWFSVPRPHLLKLEDNNRLCESICMELVKVLKQTNKSGVTSGVAELPFRFSKVGPRRADASRAPHAHPGSLFHSQMPYFVEKHRREYDVAGNLIEGGNEGGGGGGGHGGGGGGYRTGGAGGGARPRGGYSRA